jgi:rubredoxin
MARELIWVEKERFQGWVCSACGWEFQSSGPPIGKTIDEMKRNYERRRDEEFNAHVCAKHPKRPAE